MIWFLNYCWRIFATGLSFILFGFGGLFISLIIFPLQSLRYKNEIQRQAKARYTVHRTFFLFVNILKFFGLFTVKLNDLAELKKMKGHIVIANHPSLIDIVLIIAYMPNADCIVKSALFNNLFLRGVVKNVNYISNDDPTELIEDCKKSLALGYNIVIFPEGTRTDNQHKLHFKRGAANIALRCKANFQPLLISFDPITLSKKNSWYNIPKRKAVISLHLTPCIDITHHLEAKNLSIASRVLTKELKQYFSKELNLND